MGISETLGHFRWIYMLLLRCQHKSLPPKAFSSHTFPYRRALSRGPTQLPGALAPQLPSPEGRETQSSGCIGNPMLLTHSQVFHSQSLF